MPASHGERGESSTESAPGRESDSQATQERPRRWGAPLGSGGGTRLATSLGEDHVDGFVAAVPTANRETYRKHAEAAAAVFKENGALHVVECWGDDVPEGKLTSFPMAVQRKDGENVVFSWIVWPSRQVRDEGMKKAMADPRFKPDANPMPFDGKRMIYGGFETIVDA